MLNPSTGAITGTPADVVATATYTITGANSGGSTTTVISITIDDQAPLNLSYEWAVTVYTKGMPIAANSPTNSGGTITLYSVSPSLPTGLSLSPTSGVISGTPGAVTGAAEYTVTAANSAGSTTTIISVTVTTLRRRTSPTQLP